MKIFKCLLLVILMTGLSFGTAFSAPIPLRGVVEGFYGTPWTFEDRAALMEFCRRQNLNAYIYAPKDDPYHRDKWRQPYPFEKLHELENLVDVAKKNNVRFVFAVSPGLDLKYSGKNGDADFKLMMKKLDAMYEIGVRHFALFFDDLKDNNGKHHEKGKLQANFINKVQNELRVKHSDVAPLIVVPTEYYRLDMISNRGKVTSYTKDFAENLDKKIIVLYTGDGVVCDGISDEKFNEACEIYSCDLGIWWNYPVNDYALTLDGNRNAKLALGAIEKLPTKNVQAIFFNPMGQPILSRIALATGAEYANSPALYDAKKSWNKAIDEQFGELAPAMKIFADHSQHMENSWAKVGAADAEEFNTLAYLAVANTRAKKAFDFSRLEKLIDDMENSADTLLENLSPEILAECKPQLEQFKIIAQADRIAVESLKSGSLDPNLKVLREEIKKNSVTALVSEKTAVKFIDDVLAFFEK